MFDMEDEPTARWVVPMSDGEHVIQFEHGMGSGRRTIKVDGEVLIHRSWMFLLIGDEKFTHKGTNYVIRVDPIPGLKFAYSLWVNGKSFSSFVKAQNKILASWLVKLEDQQYRVILDKNSKDVCINGEKVETESEFIDDGAEVIFEVGGQPAVIRCTSGDRVTGMKYDLLVNDIEISKIKEENEPEGSEQETTTTEEKKENETTEKDETSKEEKPI